MIPIFDLSGNVANLQTAVTNSTIAADLKTFVNTRLAALPDQTATARVKVQDFMLDYQGVSSQQTQIEVALIPTPL